MTADFGGLRVVHSSRYFSGSPCDAADQDRAHSEEIIGKSPGIQHAQQCIDRVAPTEATVLISGETGTGKELFARRLHSKSLRSSGPLLSVNCAAIPDNLLESELFGFEKGAFTGAYTRQEGQLVAANRGTVFLDEIGDLSLAGQAKILRVLEQREVRPLGSRTTRAVDIRLVAAVNTDLQQLVEQGRFRQDLFFRINVISVHIPPLRERREDIPLIADHFLESLARKYARASVILAPAAHNYLMQQAWAGNVRELRNVVERAFLLSNSNIIAEQDIVEMCDMDVAWCSESTVETSANLNVCSESGPDRQTSRTSIRARRVCSSESSELYQLRKALEETKWNKSRAAEMLQWSRMTIYRKIVQYDLHPPGRDSGSVLPGIDLIAH